MLDCELQTAASALADYVSSGSNAAFQRMVHICLPLVMGTALRRTGGQRTMAEDISQMVFIDLARKAKAVRGETLSGWLHKHTCYTAAKMMRSERRRADREKRAAELIPNSLSAGSESLDDLLLGLSEGDRQALLLRYVEGRSHKEVAEALGLSRAAAQKRSERALSRLRDSMGAERGGSGLAMILAPPLKGSAELADRISKMALSSVATPLAFISKPFVSALAGATAGIALSAYPLAQAWRGDESAQASMAGQSVDQSSDAQVARLDLRAKPATPARSGSIQSPDEVVAALLEIADRHGVGSQSAQRATAILEPLPANWIHPVLLGLSQRVPAAVAGTGWYESIGSELATRWRPERMPEDLIAIWPLLPSAPRLALFQCCAATDLAATRRFLDGFENETRLGDLGVHREKYHNALREAVLGQMLKESPREAAAFFNTLPLLNAWNPDVVGEVRFLNEGRDPAIRAILWECLPEMDEYHRHRLLTRLKYHISADEKMRHAEAIRSLNTVLPLTMELLSELEAGAVKPDELRAKAVTIGVNRDEVDPLQLARIANQISDPAVRMAALEKALRKLSSGKTEERNKWMTDNLTENESELFQRIFKSLSTIY